MIPSAINQRIQPNRNGLKERGRLDPMPGHMKGLKKPQKPAASAAGKKNNGLAQRPKNKAYAAQSGSEAEACRLPSAYANVARPRHKISRGNPYDVFPNPSRGCKKENLGRP